ncbi:MAG: flagellar hook-basal body complex protein FliE [Tatlockia sp.]|nr:flagellar hook-basal body complex protein FliE [Tatlockia sp.]
MKIEDINQLNFNTEIKSIERCDQTAPSFSTWLNEKLGETNDQLISADKALQQLATNQNASLHQTMLSLEQAKLSFQLLEQIRNRVMSAYQEIMREQI